MTDYASLFDDARVDDDDSQITEFFASSKRFALPDGRAVEVELSATPAHCKRAGLHLALRAFFHLCDDHSCDSFFSVAFSPKESLAACAAKSPLAAALRMRPGLWKQACAKTPELHDALAKALAEREALALEGAAKPAREAKPLRM
jgi:hypothetical protein